MHDVQTILNEVGSDRAALFGISEGGPMSLLYAATYPERTSALVLYGTYAKRSWSPDYAFGWTDAVGRCALQHRTPLGHPARNKRHDVGAQHRQ